MINMKKIVVITGASSGIGLACAKLYSKEAFVYNLSRTPSDVEGVTNIQTDVSDEMSVSNAFKQIEIEKGHIDLLICCAGFGISGALEFTSLQDAKRQLDVNFFGAFLCSKYALPLLRPAKGRIINISSAAAFFAIPFQGFYSASKAALNAYTMCLANEVSLFNVSACLVCPGDIKTNFTENRIKSTDGESIYKNAVNKSVAVMEKDEQNGMEPATIAAFVHKIADKKKVRPIYTPGMMYKLFYALYKILPAGAVNKLVGLLYIKK